MSAEIEMRRGWRTVELRSITRPLHEAQRTSHPDLLAYLDSWMGLACYSDGIGEIQGSFTSFRMTTIFFTVADFFAAADFCEVRL